MTKYIFISGGVVSSLGKGILAASLGKLLQSRGYRVAIQKLEAYINVDAGTMNPYEHGECYVTMDGLEADLDLGHYERFLDQETSKDHYITMGDIYRGVIEQERKGDFLGKCVQSVPHITDAIKNRILALGAKQNYDFIISEVGGSIGDIESLLYIEAIRQLKYSLPPKNFLSIHLTLVPYLKSAEELKTKPTQHSVKQLQSIGIQPDIIVCRTDRPLKDLIREKIALFCSVRKENVIELQDVDIIYEVPLRLQEEGLDTVVLQTMGVLEIKASNLLEWENFLIRCRTFSSVVTIGLIGKYTDVPDAYKSMKEALVHAGASCFTKVCLELISTSDITQDNVHEKLQRLHGVILGPGYGARGIDEKILAATFAREHNLPLLGICLGMQCMVIEFAKNILNWAGASSSEFFPKTPFPVIDLMESQKQQKNKGATNRLGLHECLLTQGSIICSLYQCQRIFERHRHRYEFNNIYAKEFFAHGMRIGGTNESLGLIEAIELADHDFYLGVQYHPEYQSTPLKAHPLFVGLINAAIKKSNL